jgi:outer membrane protein assembly factor BamB
VWGDALQLWGIAAATGKQVWTARSQTSGDGWRGVLDGAAVYAMGDGPAVLGVDTATGRQVVSSGDKAMYTGWLDAVVNQLAITSTSAGITAVELASGRVRWHYPVGDDNVNLVADEQACYLLHPPTVTALDITTGTVKWRNSTGINVSDVLRDAVPQIVTVAGGTLLVPTTSGVVALDTATGRQRWASSAPASDTGRSCRPVVAGGNVVVADTGALYAFDISSGALRWQTVTGVDMYPELAASSSVVAVLLATHQKSQIPGGFLVVAAADGKARFAHHGPPGTIWSVAVSGPMVYASDGTSLQAFAGGG